MPAGTAAPMLRTGQCRHGWTQGKKQPGKGPQNPRTKRATTAGKSGPTADKKSIANYKQTTNNHHSYRGTLRHRSLNKMTVVLTIQTVLTVRKLSSHSSSRKPSRSLPQRKRQTEFRKSWKNLQYSAMMRRSNKSPQCSEDCGDVAG